VKKKTRGQLTKSLEKIFNEFIRLRDKDKPCISCGIRRVTQAGHYWPVSGNPKPSIRFCEKNVHGQCVTCNKFREGNRQGYALGLKKRYGKKILQDLDIIRSLKQNPWRPFEYEMMINKYKALVQIAKMGYRELISKQAP